MEKVTDTEDLRGTIEKLMGTEKVKGNVPLGNKVPLGREVHACIPSLR